MLSLPSGGLGGGGATAATAAAAATEKDAANSGLLAYLSPKRTQQLIARESAIALREAECARREAEMLAGAPGGVIAPAPAPVICPLCPSMTVETVQLPAQTIIKEIVTEDSLTPPGWTGPRTEELLERELRIAERERDIGRREESINRREHDASRRESWIMEQLISLGNDNPERVEEEYVYEQPAVKRTKPRVEEEYIYEQPVGKRTKSKLRELPHIVKEVVEEVVEPEVRTVVQTVTVPAPANTERVARPTPMVASPVTSGEAIPKTTAVEIITEEVVDDDDYEEYYEDERVVKRPTRPSGGARRPPNRWFGGAF